MNKNDMTTMIEDFIYNTTNLDIIDAEEAAEDLMEEMYG
jgi:hypothetical protein